MPAKFTLTKDRAGRFRFTLSAANGQVIAVSQGYSTRAAALNGVASVRRNAVEAALVDAVADADSTPTANTEPAADRAAGQVGKEAAATHPAQRRIAKLPAKAGIRTPPLPVTTTVPIPRRGSASSQAAASGQKAPKNPTTGQVVKTSTAKPKAAKPGLSIKKVKAPRTSERASGAEA